MNELTTDLKSLNEATLNNLKNSKSNNTFLSLNIINRLLLLGLNLKNLLKCMC